jgi:hypothetical protein
MNRTRIRVIIFFQKKKKKKDSIFITPKIVYKKGLCV